METSCGSSGEPLSNHAVKSHGTSRSVCVSAPQKTSALNRLLRALSVPGSPPPELLNTALNLAPPHCPDKVTPVMCSHYRRSLFPTGRSHRMGAAPRDSSMRCLIRPISRSAGRTHCPDRVQYVGVCRLFYSDSLLAKLSTPGWVASVVAWLLPLMQTVGTSPHINTADAHTWFDRGL